MSRSILIASRLFVGASALLLSQVVNVSATDYLISPERELAVSGGVVTAATGDKLILDAEKIRSYSCEGVPSASDSEFAFSTTIDAPAGGTDLTARAIGKMAPKITEGTGIEGTTRVSFTTSVKGRHQIAVADAKSGGESVRFRCVATTLFGSFNTVANDYNFLELRNITDKPINLKVRVVGFNGSTVKTLTKTLEAGRRTDINLHSLAPDTYGSIRITHDGPSKRLVGQVSFYRDIAGALQQTGHNVLKEAQE